MADGLNITARRYVLVNVSAPFQCFPHIVTFLGAEWRGFWHPGTNFCEDYACRGTSMIGAGRLSQCRILIEGTGAVSRYKLSRSQKTVTVQDFDYGQMRVSGYMNHYKFVLGAGAIKNRDKLIKHTVRVMVSCLLLFCHIAFISATFKNLIWIHVHEILGQ